MLLLCMTMKELYARLYERIKPDYFGNGGDRTDQNTPERQMCEDLGIELVWGLVEEKSKVQAKW